jgi:hypothetical protein
MAAPHRMYEHCWRSIPLFSGRDVLALTFA